jgi:glycerol uptake facilitator protein
MSPYMAEVIGTALVIIFGNGVVANTLLKGSKGHNGGWIVITLGWGMAVFIGVYASADASGAHLNPAVSLALATLGKFDWATVPGYVIAQFVGAAIGQLFVWVMYRQHFDATEDPGLQRACFCNEPAIRHLPSNLITETLATFVFVLAILFIQGPDAGLGSLKALPVALLVLAMGLSLGGPTGYAINPVRDLMPRIMHAILPIKGKGSSDWAYAWVPVLGPALGGILAALVYPMLS